ncbi:peptidoglycan-binding protein [Streptomyces sp. DSM 40484]|uniref:peptidoglycan-binding protein n=1 Tax=Streptomyces kroppenstedtii TaxID=3051181 RepID=UPI0028D7B61E|nr:peptidoglycan-binding protein [Streptomyces sp. DSM 40484]
MTRPPEDRGDGTEKEPAATVPAAGQGRRRVRSIGAVIALALAGVAVVVTVPWGQGGRPTPSGTEPKASTVKVVRTDLSDSRALEGTLGYGTPQTVKGAGNGMVTWLAPVGTKVSRGKPLYRVDDTAVPVFYGSVPVYRNLTARNTVGRDVRVIVDNLRALGYDTGAQPSPGHVVSVKVPADATAPQESEQEALGSRADEATSGDGRQGSGASAPAPDPAPAPAPAPAGKGTESAEGAGGVTRVQVGSGDGVYTESLVSAVKRWQADRGVPSTGVIEPGDVAVFSGAVRVEGASAQVGDPVAGALLRVTPTAKAVTVQVDVSEAGSVKRGDRVTLRLPGGTSAAGKVTGVGTDAEQPEGGGPESKVTVTISFVDPRTVRKLDSAPVQVEFVSETRDGVLAVPVTALLALREGGYGLRRADGETVAVETGLFAKGMVEITGNGITEGTRVVTSS